jgi:hypothetical protein
VLLPLVGLVKYRFTGVKAVKKSKTPVNWFYWIYAFGNYFLNPVNNNQAVARE